eukprot:CCRYP_000839-RA/>CCRYP_000839-RA protein AED:0.10 eAED:0.10 QI:314/1/1/1/1/1/2/400/455
MNNMSKNPFGIKFEDGSESSRSFIGGTNNKAVVESDYDAAEAAVAGLESLMDDGNISGEFFSSVSSPFIPVDYLFFCTIVRSEIDEGLLICCIFEHAPYLLFTVGYSSSHASGPKRTHDDSSGRGSDENSSKKKKHLTSERREERNLREKERSLKITQQIHELRSLLSSGGVIVPKGTKSTILTEAANYIRLLQQNQYRSEMDKAQLIQEVQRIGNGAIGQRAAVAIRHVANQNGLSSVADFDESPLLPTSAPQTTSHPGDIMTDSLDDRQYRCIFNSCSVGMAIATMGGSFIDCNVAFTQLSNYTKEELKAMTIFNITSREDLQGAFDMMSQLITPPTPGGLDDDGNSIDSGKVQPPVILRSAIKHRNDLGLSVSMIRGDDGVARYFNVTLVKLPSSMGLGNTRPVPATADMSSEGSNQQLQSSGFLAPPSDVQSQAMNKQLFPVMNTPQYTAG